MMNNQKRNSVTPQKMMTICIQFHQHISDYKQIRASQLESNAALALLNKNPHIWLTLHFDTTSQIAIDGECRVLTSLSGLLFNSIFPIKSQLEFPIFVQLKFFEKPSNKSLVFNLECTALYLILIWCWLKQKCYGWELNLCANCVITK